jgi:NAD(P)-dependent dehydrogenase (short-subunit alcohol dehydrogenase family)
LIVILGDVEELTVPMIARLEYDGCRVRQVVPGPALKTLAGDRYEADLTSPEQVAALHQALRGREENQVGWIINLLPLSRDPRAAKSTTYQAASDRTLAMFNICKEFQQELVAAAKTGGGRLLNVTAIDGAFGLNGGNFAALDSAGTLGVCKTFYRESPQVQVKLIDVDPDTEKPALATRVINELFLDDEFCEVGLTHTRRCKIQLQVEQTAPQSLPPLPISTGDVVVVTGGGYGITAEVTKSLAQSRPHLIIVGRSQRPELEPVETRSLNRAGLREALLAQARARGAKILPMEIEREVDRTLKDRQMRDNLAAFEKLGATVEYHAVDVRDAGSFGGLIDDLYRRFGKIDGVIHGAGVIQDKFIRDKTLASFDAVFGTKVESSLILASKLRFETLKFIVFFSSVAGRFGNAGQVDYSAANEFLNKLAAHLNHKWPSTRAVAINWGPWDAGMVSDQLRAQFAARNIPLITIPEGIRFLETELSRQEGATAEVVVC